MKIIERHARAVLSLSDSEQEALIEQVIAQKLNVKQTEDRVHQKRRRRPKAQNLRFAQDVTQARDEVGKSPKRFNKQDYMLSIKTKIMKIIMK